MNKEFQELKKQWGDNSRERAQIIEEMRKNLKKGTTTVPLKWNNRSLK